MKENEVQPHTEGEKTERSAYDTFLVMMEKLNRRAPQGRRPYKEADTALDSPSNAQGAVRIMLDEIARIDSNLSKQGHTLLDDVQRKREAEKKVQESKLEEQVKSLSTAVTENPTTVIGGTPFRTALQIVRDPGYQRRKAEEVIADLPSTTERRVRDNLAIAERIIYNGKRRG